MDHSKWIQKAHRMRQVPEVLDKMIDAVLAYRPKPKSKATQADVRRKRAALMPAKGKTRVTDGQRRQSAADRGGDWVGENTIDKQVIDRARGGHVLNLCNAAAAAWRARECVCRICSVLLSLGGGRHRCVCRPTLVSCSFT